MTLRQDGQPAIVLVDDDFHSARLMLRMLAAHDGPSVEWMSQDDALETLPVTAALPMFAGQFMVVVDLKSSSTATRDFIREFREQAPALLVVAMAPTLDRALRNELLDAGAAAVFERHADINLYRREAAAIVAFWVRSQRLDAVGT
jgi:hypothetical protein